MSTHRPGHLSSAQKKPFKRRHGHRSKGAIKRSGGGKQELDRVSVKNARKVDSRVMRRNQAKQARDLHRERQRDDRRGAAPRVVAMVSLGLEVQLDLIRGYILRQCGQEDQLTKAGPVSFAVKKHRTRLTLFQAPANLYAIMDLVKTADLLVLVLHAAEGIQEIGAHLISVLKAQGLPTVLPIIQGLDALPAKHQHATRKAYLAQVQHEFPTVSRLLPLDKQGDAAQVVRFLCSTAVRTTEWRAHRPFVMAESFAFEANVASQQRQQLQGFQSIEGEDKGPVGTLKVTGYVRGGTPLSANHLVHLPGFGDFQLVGIASATEPVPSSRSRGSPPDVAGVVIDQATDERDTLQAEQDVDPLAGEQVFPTAAEMADSDSEDAVRMDDTHMRKRVPMGTSAYQAAWIPDEASWSDASEEVELNPRLAELGAKAVMDFSSDDSSDESYEPPAHVDGEDDDDDDGSDALDQMIDIEGLADGEADEGDHPDFHRVEVEKDLPTLEQDEVDWPDEVDVPFGKLAKTRFQKYRHLKSFRTSPWDAKENLPMDYARLFQFESFARARKRFMRVEHGADPGTYVTVHVKDFPQSMCKYINAATPLIVGGLFRHEHKTSVLTFSVGKCVDYGEPIQSKEDGLVFCFGWRRVTSPPLFAQNNPSCDKHKYERFLHAGRASSAIIYGPITYGPATMVMLKKDAESGVLKLAGSGSLLSVDPDRLCVKKIILTGVPLKIHKRSAVIRGMFYHPEDILWFKPAELWTKMGRKGHIREPIGTHGRMKCVFDGHLNPSDTICLSLYRRVFPKMETRPLLYGEDIL